MHPPLRWNGPTSPPERGCQRTSRSVSLESEIGKWEVGMNGGVLRERFLVRVFSSLVFAVEWHWCVSTKLKTVAMVMGSVCVQSELRENKKTGGSHHVLIGEKGPGLLSVCPNI